MSETKTYTDKAFRTAIVIIGFIILVLLLTLISRGHQKSVIIETIFFLIALAIGIFGVIGSVQTIKGLRETKSFKTFFAILINFGATAIWILFISSIVLIITTGLPPQD
ncbi:MAG TPA: hypothetical protein VGB95_02900 [Chitinophagales bacterium]